MSVNHPAPRPPERLERSVAPRPVPLSDPAARLETEYLSNRASRWLVERIVAGDYQPSEDLPGADELARMFDVSRPVIREALREVATLGLVHSRQGRRTTVAPTTEWSHLAPAVLAARIEVGAFTDILLELIELRRMIEVEAAAMAADRATDEDVERIRAGLEELERHLEDREAFTRADVDFHDAILRATQNHLIPNLFRQIRPGLEVARGFSLRSRPDATQASQEGHRAVFAAIERHAPDEARAAMTEHLSWTANLRLSERDGRLSVRRGAGGTDAR